MTPGMIPFRALLFNAGVSLSFVGGIALLALSHTLWQAIIASALCAGLGILKFVVYKRAWALFK